MVGRCGVARSGFGGRAQCARYAAPFMKDSAPASDILWSSGIDPASLIELMPRGWTEAQIFENYPGVTAEDLRACLAYAHEVLAGEKVYPLTADR